MASREEARRAGLRSDANRCFVCGPANPIGLNLVFRLDGELCRSEFTPGENHCGYDNVTHGGIIYAALDDVMANWLFLKGHRAFTAKCEVRYRAPLPLHTEVALTGECVQQRGRLARLQGAMHRVDTGDLMAEAEAAFMLDGGKGEARA